MNLIIEDGILIAVKGKLPEPLVLPNTITAIGEKAFKEKKSLHSIVIPDSVTSIDEGAFWGCTSLTSITIPDSVTSIGDCAFDFCTSLTSITVASGNNVYHSAGNCLIETASKKLILGCKNSVIPTDGSVTSIGSSAFSWCKSLTSITIPDSVTSIGESAFNNCTGLQKVYYASTADEWLSISLGGNNYYLSSATQYFYSEIQPTKKGYFWYYVNGTPTIWKMDTEFTYTVNDDNVTCTITGLLINTESVLIIPETIDGYNVIAIDKEAFKNCLSFTSVTIPDSVESIGYLAFNGCTSLTSITIGNSVTSISSYAFEGCTSLKKVYYTGDIESWLKISFNEGSNPCCNGAELYFNDKLVTEVTVPNTITKIGDYAFSYCTSLTSITIGNSVTSISSGAFYKCTSLTSITIPDSVTSIGESAFSCCASLAKIAIPKGINIDLYAFIGTRLTQKTSKFYKACRFTEEGFYCRDVQYKIDEPSPFIEDIVICNRGYHFCNNIASLFNYYHGKIDEDIAIFECEPHGKIMTNEENKYVAQSITLTRRVYEDEVLKILSGQVED